MSQTSLSMPEADKNPANQEQEFRFEDAITRLQEIVRELEATDFNLDEALESYEQGMSIAKDCLERLEKAELRVRKLRLENDGVS